jgi:GAF domain-containing protein
MLKISFKNRSLKHTGMYVLLAMFLVFSMEYLVIRYKIEGLEEVEEKKDFTRSAQLSSQQIALLVQQYLNGQKNLSAEIISSLDQQDHLLQIVQNGGRMDGTEVFLKPLSKLPQISFKELQASWNKYKANVMVVAVQPETEPVFDSTGMPIVTEWMKAKTMLPAQWMTLSNWYANLELDLTEEAGIRKNSVENWVFTFIFSDLILLVGIFYLFQRNVIGAINQLKENTVSQHQKKDLPENEIGSLTREVNEVLEQLKDATEFVGAIGDGKLDFDYRTLDSEYATGKNKLADSLIAMQSKLKEMSIAEQRRQWANEGLSKFVDILRSSNDDIYILGDKIISALVQYTGSNQGGLYALNDEDENYKHLELISKFAFDIKKYEKQKIKLGEGILGQTFLEKQTTVLNVIPEEYIRITSGLGESNPKALLMVPLKVDKEVYGIVELASFDTYEQHEIDFAEKLAETIASTLASVKSAQKNRQLIEQFQQQTEQMRAQEEEMRQNMEELQATQEELARKENDYIERIKSLESESGEAEQLKVDLQNTRNELKHKTQSLERQVLDLESRLAQKPSRSDDWALAEEVADNLRINLEALKITQQELTRK